MCHRPHAVHVICANPNPVLGNKAVPKCLRRQTRPFNVEEDHIGLDTILNRNSGCIAKQLAQTFCVLVIFRHALHVML